MNSDSSETSQHDPSLINPTHFSELSLKKHVIHIERPMKKAFPFYRWASLPPWLFITQSNFGVPLLLSTAVMRLPDRTGGCSRGVFCYLHLTNHPVTVLMCKANEIGEHQVGITGQALLKDLCLLYVAAPKAPLATVFTQGEKGIVDVLKQPNPETVNSWRKPSLWPCITGVHWSLLLSSIFAPPNPIPLEVFVNRREHRRPFN